MNIQWSEGMGLTKREIFAAMAMQGLLSNGNNRAFSPEFIASFALTQAHYLLIELAKEPQA